MPRQVAPVGTFGPTDHLAGWGHLVMAAVWDSYGGRLRAFNVVVGVHFVLRT